MGKKQTLLPAESQGRMEIKYLFLLFICVFHPVFNLSIMPLFPEEPYVEAFAGSF